MLRPGQTFHVPAHFTASKVAKTGLSPTVSIYDSAGTLVVSAQAMSEKTLGLYYYALTLASDAAPGIWYYNAHTADATCDQQDIAGSFEVESQATAARLACLDAAVSTRSSHSAADVWAVTSRTLSSYGTLVADVATAVWAAGTRTLTAAGSLASDTATAVWGAATTALTTVGSIGLLAVQRLGLLGSGAVTVAAPVSTSGSLTIVRGDDYLAADDPSRALTWARPTTGWPASLVGATIIMTIRARNTDGTGGAVITTSTVSTTATGVTADLTAAQTALLPLSAPQTVPSIVYDVQATLAAPLAGHISTLARGAGIVLEDATHA